MGCLVWLVRGVSGVAISDAFSSLVLPHHRLTAVRDIERLVQFSGVRHDCITAGGGNDNPVTAQEQGWVAGDAGATVTRRRVRLRVVRLGPALTCCGYSVEVDGMG